LLLPRLSVYPIDWLFVSDRARPPAHIIGLEQEQAGEPMMDVPPNPGPSLARHRQVAIDIAAEVRTKRRSGIALCLSGGGFRASIFHLGVLRRLDELGVLSQIRTICSVSGGSITSAHLAARLVAVFRDRPIPYVGPIFSDWEKQIGQPFHAFVHRDIRTGPILARLLPWNWLKPTTSARRLTRKYRTYLTDLPIGALPDKPRFIFCATDMVFGVSWIFERRRMGDWMAGYAVPPPDWPLASAVAASSCFPPIFSPLPLGLPARAFRHGRAAASKELLARLSLTDGGVYDNLGLEPVWKDHEVVLVSDGGGKLSFDWRRDFVGEVMRYPAIIQNQAIALRRRWLIANLETATFQGTYWGIGSSPSLYALDSPGYTSDFAARTIAGVRTDLDSFTIPEVAVLENHGYLLADAALRRRLPILRPQSATPLTIPNPEWMDERKAVAAMEDSGKRVSWKRLIKQNRLVSRMMNLGCERQV
jgi:NTE family protein